MLNSIPPIHYPLSWESYFRKSISLQKCSMEKIFLTSVALPTEELDAAGLFIWKIRGYAAC